MKRPAYTDWESWSYDEAPMWDEDYPSPKDSKRGRGEWQVCEECNQAYQGEAPLCPTCETSEEREDGEEA